MAAGDEAATARTASGEVDDAASTPRRGMLATLRTAVAGLGSLVVPPTCLACQTALAEHDSICARCWSDIAFIRAPLCDRLGLPLPFGGDGGPLISAAAAASPPAYDRARAVAVWRHQGVLQRLVHGLKYQDRHDARRLFGRWLVTAGADMMPGIDVMVPVPLSRWRLLRRQFNQSAVLAQEISQRTGLPWRHDLLVRTRSTPPQVGLTREQRRANVRGAFDVPERRRSRVEGKALLLVDDVITTGATAEAAARALKAAGAARVDVLAVGLVTDPRSVTV